MGYCLQIYFSLQNCYRGVKKIICWFNCFKFCCACGQPTRRKRPNRIHPNSEQAVKQKQIMQYVGEGFFIEEIFDYMINKVFEHEEMKNEDRKKQSRFKFRGAGRLAGMGGSTKRPKKKKTFRQAGKATQMGVIASKPKSSIEDEEDEEDVVPNKKWTFKSVGKVTRMKNSMPIPKKNKWSFKSIANFFRFGPKAPENAEIAERIEENMEGAKKRKTLKGYGKLAKMGFLRNAAPDEVDPGKKKKTLKGFGKLAKMGFLRNADPEEVDPSKKKKTLKGFGKLAKMGFLRNADEVEKPKSKFSIKGLGKLSKLGFFNSDKENKPKEEKAAKRRKTLKSYGKTSIMGARATKKPKSEKKGKAKKSWTFKTLGKLTQFGVNMTNSNHPKTKGNKWTFRKLTRATQIGANVLRPTRPKKYKKKTFAFKFLAKFVNMGGKKEECTCGDGPNDMYECTCSDSEDE